MNEIDLREATYEAEYSLLGAILLMSENTDALKQCLKITPPSDFLNYHYGEIYQAMNDAAGPPNQIVVAHELVRMGKFVAGDCALLSEMVARCPSPLDFIHYARVVHEYSLQRGGKARPVFKGGV